MIRICLLTSGLDIDCPGQLLVGMARKRPLVSTLGDLFTAKHRAWTSIPMHQLPVVGSTMLRRHVDYRAFAFCDLVKVDRRKETKQDGPPTTKLPERAGQGDKTYLHSISTQAPCQFSNVASQGSRAYRIYLLHTRLPCGIPAFEPPFFHISRGLRVCQRGSSSPPNPKTLKITAFPSPPLPLANHRAPQPASPTIFGTWVLQFPETELTIHIPTTEGQT